MVGDEHPLDTVEDEQPGSGEQLAQEEVAELERRLPAEPDDRLPGHVAEGALAEIRHHGAPLVKRIPEAACPVGADVRRTASRPLPRQHALAGATYGLEQQHRMRLGRPGPVVEGGGLSLSPDELVGADVRRLRAQRRRLWSRRPAVARVFELAW